MKRRDIVFIGLGVMLIALLTLGTVRIRARQHAESVNCGNYMSSIGFSARLWADDNNGFLPKDFISMSNELATPKILICPGDRSRRAALDWASFGPSNCSYQILTPGVPWNDTNAFFRCENHGHLGYADGTVFDGVRRRSKGSR